MDLSSLSKGLNQAKEENSISMVNEENKSQVQDNSKNMLKDTSAIIQSISKTPFNELVEQNKSAKQKVFEDSSLYNKAINKKKRLKFKQPFIEYVDIESYKTFNSLMCFSDPHTEPKEKKCKCLIY